MFKLFDNIEYILINFSLKKSYNIDDTYNGIYQYCHPKHPHLSWVMCQRTQSTSKRWLKHTQTHTHTAQQNNNHPLNMLSPYGGHAPLRSHCVQTVVFCCLCCHSPIVLEGGQNRQKVGLLLLDVLPIVLAHVANVHVHDAAVLLDAGRVWAVRGCCVFFSSAENVCGTQSNRN